MSWLKGNLCPYMEGVFDCTFEASFVLQSLMPFLGHILSRPSVGGVKANKGAKLPFPIERLLLPC